MKELRPLALTLWFPVYSVEHDSWTPLVHTQRQRPVGEERRGGQMLLAPTECETVRNGEDYPGFPES